MMTLEKFIKDLPTLDWYYNMADDHRAFLDGAAEISHYRSLAEENGGEWKKAFDEQRNAHKI